jgi:hypothetical protein
MHCVAQAKAWSGVLETAVQVLCSKQEELSKKNVYNAAGMV